MYDLELAKSVINKWLIPYSMNGTSIAPHLVLIDSLKGRLTWIKGCKELELGISEKSRASCDHRLCDNPCDIINATISAKNAELFAFSVTNPSSNFS